MNRNCITKTRIAFFALLLHVLYVVLFAIIMLITCLLEVPCNRGGLYSLFFTTSILQIVLYPLATTAFNAISIIFQIIALKEKESKIKNIIMMVFAILYEIACIILWGIFWEGAMGV